MIDPDPAQQHCTVIYEFLSSGELVVVEHEKIQTGRYTLGRSAADSGRMPLNFVVETDKKAPGCNGQMTYDAGVTRTLQVAFAGDELQVFETNDPSEDATVLLKQSTIIALSE